MNISLRSRIYFGFALIVCVLIANGLVSLSALHEFRTSADSVKRADDVGAEVLNLDRMIQELQLRVDRYVGSGHESDRNRAKQILHQLQQDVSQRTSSPKDEKFAALFQKIQTHLAEYDRQFDLVVVERSQRENLVQEQLPARSDAIDRILRNWTEQSSANDSSSESRLAISFCGSNLATAEKQLLRYFENPDSRFVNAAVEALNEARRHAATIDQQPESKQQLLAAVDDFQRVGLRAVQTTRSYLFFRNVVLAGEASEVRYYSKSLSTLAADRMVQSSQQLDQAGTRVQYQTWTAILIAVLLSVVVAGRLGYVVVPPVTALTQAFAKLSKGETLTEIPATNRTDEIGQMAQAARIFSNQNRQTRQLLAESQQMAERLRNQTLRLEETNQELDHFAYVASHDLKSPLRGIRHLAQWIEEDADGRLSEQCIEYLDLLRSRIEKMEMLLQDLLDYSRIGRLDPRPETVDLSAVLETVVELSDNPRQVAVQWPGDLPTIVTVRSPLEQVFLNLIGNAIKHNHRETDGWVKIGYKTAGDFYEFEIRDNGPGINRKHHERIFQMYQRVGDPNVPGSGMGLAICKKQIENLGGQIIVESTLDQGTCFRFTWPVSIHQEEKEAASVGS